MYIQPLSIFSMPWKIECSFCVSSRFLQLLEMFGAGTACIVCPINRINYLGSDLLIPTLEHEKPLFARIKDTLSDIQYGRIEHPWAVLID